MIIREVEGILGDTVVVEVTKEIRVGGLYKMVPTEAYLGIDYGTARVDDIVLRDDMALDIQEQANEFTRLHLECMEGDMLEQETKRLATQPWVVYTYTGKGGDTLALPLEEFVIHSTMY